VSYLDQEGRKHHVEIRTRPITENGNIVGLVGISRDITARKQSEELLLNAKNLLEQMVDKRTKELEEKAVQLTESEKRYRAIFENTGAATCIIEKDFTVSFLNGEFERLTGHSKEEFEGKIKLTTLIHEEDLPRLKEYHRLRRIDPAAAPRHYDFRMVDRAGRIRDLFATIDLIPGTMKSVASVLDITDRKQMERSLMEREKELQVHSRHLEEMNTALNVLLRKLETEKQSVEAEILTNAKENIIPYLDSIENTALDESQRLCIDAIRKNLSAILSPFVKNMKTRYPGLSSKESQVARLITQGRTTKDIAAILKISPKAVESHRYNIRKKLRISGKRSNLRDFLLKLSDRH
jgi:PAS domain S-box-containing protein